MIHQDAINLMQTMICLCIAYNCLGRNAKTCKETIASIRLSFVGLGVASVLIAALPYWHALHGPSSLWANAHPASILFEGAVLAVQWVTRKHWAAGVPMRYQKYAHDPRRAVVPMRRSTDRSTDLRIAK